MRAQQFPPLHMFALIAAFLLPWYDLVRVNAQQSPNWTATPFNPPALPLTVRSPYMSTWLPQGNDPDSIATTWPTFWTTGLPGYVNDTGWWVAVVVDGTMYQIVGYPNMTINNTNHATLEKVEFTATRTSFSLTAGSMDINASFISPIEPTDLVRQSLPFAYLTMSASTNDGAAHDLRMYADVALQYITGDTSLLAEWSAFDDDEHIVLSARLQEPAAFTEVSNFVQDAEQHFSFKRIDNVTTTWQAGNRDTLTREGMRDMSIQLDNSVNTTFRPVYHNLDWPVLSIESDFGSIESTLEPAVWAIGQTRSPAVQYRSQGGSIMDYYPYYWTAYANGTYASTAFLDDYSRNAAASSAFDLQLQQAGLNVSSDYAGLLALATRQVFGSIEITVSQTSDGEYNTSDVKVFMKNMGGIGTDAADSQSKQSVNSVDVMYAAFPAFLYANPELAGYLLAPVLEYMGSRQFTLDYAGLNIGSAYPNATADATNQAHDYGIEESANLLIMTLAYSQRSGNGTFISQYYTLLRKWASYLVDNTLEANQPSADSYTSSVASEFGQSNLALKGIIGISAMAKMADIAGVDTDASSFSTTAASYMSQWQQKSVSNDSSLVDFLYQQEGTNGLIYNLYADKLLQLDFVAEEVYNMATAYYTSEISQSTYGLALDSSDQGVTTIHWTMFAAAAATDYATQALMVSSIYDYASSNQKDSPLSTVYSPSSGTPPTSNAGINSPTVGGVFSLLALNTTMRTIEIDPVDVAGLNATQESKSRKGAIAGGVIGSIAGLALVAGAVRYLRRRHTRLLEIELRHAGFVPFAGPSTQPPMVSIEAPGRVMRLRALPEKGYAMWEKAPISDADLSESSGLESTDVMSTYFRSTDTGSLMPGVATSDSSWWSPLSPQYRLRRALVREHTQLRVEAVQLRREMERVWCGSGIGATSVATSLPRYCEPTSQFQSPRP